MQASIYLLAFVTVLSVVYLVGQLTVPPPLSSPDPWLRAVPVSWGIVDAFGTVLVLMLAALGASLVVGLGLLGLVCLGAV